MVGIEVGWKVPGKTLLVSRNPKAHFPIFFMSKEVNIICTFVTLARVHLEALLLSYGNEDIIVL